LILPAAAQDGQLPGAIPAVSPPPDHIAVAGGGGYNRTGSRHRSHQGDFRLTRFDMQQSGDHVEIIRTVEGRFQPAYRQFVVCLHGGAVASAMIDGRELDLEAAMVILPADGWRRLQIYVTASPI
jgi:hypothetical protein